MLTKRGQITIFIIIGILILFAFAFVFYITTLTAEKKEILARPVIEEVPTEINPLVLYVEECAKQTAVTGLRKIGESGGYITPRGVYSHENPTDSDGVAISENTNTTAAYWLYNKNPNTENTILFASNAPELKRTGGRNDYSIESQLDAYVNENLAVCLDNFSIFRKQGYTIKEGEIDTITTIAPSKVTVLVAYPLDVSIGKSSSSLSKFYTEVDVPLKQMYDLAKEIAMLESNYTFLEENTLNLIESFSAVDASKLPPMTDSTFEFGKMVLWPVISVEENVRDMLSSYVPMLRVYQSKGFYRYAFPAGGVLADVKQRIYDNMILDLNKPVPYKVRFDYLEWPIYFDANDNAGVVMPQSASVSFAGFNFGMQRYKAVYDISYPVLVTINDQSALKGKGYSFAFALEANIRNNRAVANGQELPVPVSAFEQSMLCSQNQRNSAEYTLSVKDSYNSSDLAGAQILFSAGGEDCFIAETASDVKAKLPIAYGGLLTFIKTGYLSKSIPIDTKQQVSEPDSRITAKLDMLGTIDVTVKKKKVAKCIAGICYPGSGFVSGIETGWFFRSLPAYSLEDNEDAVVTLERVSDNEQQFSSAFTIRGDETKQITLAPGKYKVNIQLVLNEEVKIPSEIRCVEVPKGVFGERKEKECFTINETIFDVFPSGGVNLDTEETYWELTPNNLYKSNKITFMAASVALADVPENLRVIEDLQQIGEISNLSKQYSTELSPRIE